MDLGELLAGLEPLQRRAVALVYFEGRTLRETADLLTVERRVIASAMSVVFREVARWVLEPEDDAIGLTAAPATPM